MNQRTNNSRWFCQSDKVKSKLPQSFVQAILGNHENQRTYVSEGFEQWLRPIGERRTLERKRYYNLYGGAQRYVSDRGGESNAG